MFNILYEKENKKIDNLKTINDIPNDLCDKYKIKNIINDILIKDYKTDGLIFKIDYNSNIRIYQNNLKKFGIYSQFKPLTIHIKQETNRLLYLYSEQWFKNKDDYIMHYFYDIDEDRIIHKSVLYAFALMNIEPTEEEKIIARYNFNKYIKSQEHIRLINRI